MSLTRKLSAAGAVVALTAAALLTAPAAQAAGAAPAAAAASGWVPMGTHSSYGACNATGQYLVSIWLIPDFYCDPYAPYMLYGWK
ncbi:hypothetical protein ACWD4V_17120 [Streptomyces tsukubensis]